MDITDDELRALVRDSVARHLGAPAASQLETPLVRLHSSHVRLALPSGGDLDGPCLIEPHLPCVHCGYCQSLGH